MSKTVVMINIYEMHTFGLINNSVLKCRITKGD